MKKTLLLSMLSLLAFTATACNKEEEDDMIDDFVRVEPFDLIFNDGFSNPNIVTPEKSTFFSIATVEDTSSYDTLSDGDLWPMAWSDDGYIYTPNGDGKGFDLSSHMADIAMNRVDGHVDTFNVTGERIYPNTEIGQVWGHPNVYNRKPTGMLSIDGILYMAVQDLNKSETPGIFNDAPNATILRSDDKGITWEWNEEEAMFSNYKFTTIMFLDYGQDSEANTFDDYVYVYGMDYNWRDSFSNTVSDPQSLYLARMRKADIQDRSQWEFYTGDLDGNASWSAPGEIDERTPVLTDKRRVYNNAISGNSKSMSVISQGSIVYNEAIDRYIYSSWTEYTFEFYEAPTPWGPWKHFLQKDFGPYPWKNNRFGGYATVMPSKFISEDGTTMWISSSTFAGKINKYNMSLRKLNVALANNTVAENTKNSDNLANPENGSQATGVSMATSLGLKNKLNDGSKTVWDTSYNGLQKTVDYWGIVWNQAYNMNELVYTVGRVNAEEGGWFTDFKVQVRRDNEWHDVENLYVSSDYPYDATLESFAEVTFKFDDTHGDGIRVIGVPGGPLYYTSAAELEVFFRD